ncbi:MAG: TIGR00282 family metallophosphoesterase [Chloroflexota bacterium]
MHGGHITHESGVREVGGEEHAAPVGRTRLGNPTNGDAPRPAGACRVLLIGDLIGKPGRLAVEQVLPGLREERGIDFVTANGENVAGGMGLTPSTADAILASGVDVITSGNHIWDKREIYPYLETTDRVLRPHNYGSHDVPGRGWGTYDALDGSQVTVINLQGRTFMQPIDNPFTDADALLDESSAPEPLPPIRLVDFHCELTSEKNALGLYLDGRVSAVVGTHTHIVTGDERILPGGTAYQTDLGMTGPVWSVIGFEPRTVLPRFINALPTRFEVGSGPVIFNALQVDIDPATGRALALERIQRLVEV